MMRASKPQTDISHGMRAELLHKPPGEVQRTLDPDLLQRLARMRAEASRAEGGASAAGDPAARKQTQLEQLFTQACSALAYDAALSFFRTLKTCAVHSTCSCSVASVA